jgi:hypothetical protein
MTSVNWYHHLQYTPKKEDIQVGAFSMEIDLARDINAWKHRLVLTIDDKLTWLRERNYGTRLQYNSIVDPNAYMVVFEIFITLSPEEKTEYYLFWVS